LHKILNPAVGVKGRYRFVVRDGATHAIKRETDWIPNIITDLGLNSWGLGTFNCSFCQIGTGVTTPATTDTALATYAASTSSSSNSTGNSGSPDYEGYRTFFYRFNVGVLSGNYSEIGVGMASSGSLFSRALIVDGGGSPTTITIISTEYLDVYYELRIVPPLTDATSTISVTGLGSIDVTRRAFAVGSWRPQSSGSYLPMLNVNPNGNYVASNTLVAYTATSIGGSSINGSNSSYTSGSYQRGFTFSVGIGSAVTYGLISMVSGDSDSYIGWQFSLDPVINKTALQTLSLTGAVSWARA